MDINPQSDCLTGIDFLWWFITLWNIVILEFHYGTMIGIELTLFMVNGTGLWEKYDAMTTVGTFHSNV